MSTRSLGLTTHMKVRGPSMAGLPGLMWPPRSPLSLGSHASKRERCKANQNKKRKNDQGQQEQQQDDEDGAAAAAAKMVGEETFSVPVSCVCVWVSRTS